jgi:TrkA domain protein
MGEVRETKLPGVGVRHEFMSERGEAIGVLVHHDGRRDVLVYSADDPDACSASIELSRADTRTLSELLGASQVTEVLGVVQQEVAGLAIEWIEVPDDSPGAGASIADGEYRRRTGASIVAVLRGGESIPAPEPDFVLQPGDTVVAVGTREGVVALASLLVT